jgi:prepilin-type processing-associated H-X9-DG protein
LLVVVAIIALLIAILVPALGSARKAERNVACQANLKSIAAFGFAYAQDWDGFLPSNGCNPSDASPAGFWYNISTTRWFVKAPPYGLGPMTVSGELGYVSHVSANPLLCPEVGAQLTLQQPTTYPSYSLNEYLGGLGNTFSPPTIGLLHPQTYWFGDGGTYGKTGGFDFWAELQLFSYTLPVAPGGHWPWPWPHIDNATSIYVDVPGHPGRNVCNFAYGDGHAEGLALAAFQAFTAPALATFNNSAAGSGGGQ